MKMQSKSCLMWRLLSLIGAAIFLIPLTAQALTGPDLRVTKGPSGGGPITVITPPPSGPCTNQVVVSGMHYPTQSCAQSTPGFLAGMLTSFHFTSKCPPPNQLLGVTNVTCQNAPIPGFPTGSVYQGTACCGIIPPPTAKGSFDLKTNKGERGVDGVVTAAPSTVRFDIKKSTGGVQIPGTYTFTVACAPLPYTGGPVTVTLPGSGVTTVSVPSGDTCTVTEATLNPSNWNPPTFTGSGVTVVGSGPWSANVGPVNANGGIVNVANRPKEVSTCGVNAVGMCGGTCNDKSKSCQKDIKTGICGCSDVVANGNLTVLKNVVNPLGVATPSTFSMTSHCTPPTGLPISTPLSVPANSGISLATPIPANSSCSVTEIPLASIPNVKACNGGSASWSTIYSPPLATITAGSTATLTVTNTLACDKTCPDGQTEVTFPWSHTKYCCDGRDGRPNPDKFCCYPKK